MNERPILFSGPMVRAILDGRKTQTRRIVKLNHAGRAARASRNWHLDDPDAVQACPYGQVGDRLWVREVFFYRNNKTAVVHRADLSAIEAAGAGALYGGWKPSIHMPRWACRTVLEITDVRVERVQEISEEDAIAEGVTIKPDAEIAARVAGDTSARMEFWALWSSISGPDSWAANPWVWAITFQRVTA